MSEGGNSERRTWTGTMAARRFVAAGNTKGGGGGSTRLVALTRW